MLIAMARLLVLMQQPTILRELEGKEELKIPLQNQKILRHQSGRCEMGAVLD